jgi:transposase
VVRLADGGPRDPGAPLRRVGRFADRGRAVARVRPRLDRPGRLVEQANARIRTLLTLAYVVCCDETPIRVGPKKAKRYLLVAATKSLTWYMLGGLDMDTFKKFVLADVTGVVVHDRYQNYDATELGRRDHQLCTQLDP